MAVCFEIVPCPPAPPSTVTLELEPGDRCSDIIEELINGRKTKKGAWQLVEQWHNCKRVIGLEEDVHNLNKQWGQGPSTDVRFQLRQTTQEVKNKTAKAKAKKIRMKGALIAQPKKFLVGRKCTHKRLYCARWVMDQALRQSRKRYSNLLLNRLVKRDPLWGPLESTPLDALQADLNAQKASNLKLSSEIADLNITTTRLRNQTHPLRQKEQELTKRLTQLQEDTIVKREEKERRGPRDLTQVQTDIIKLKRELETRNRLNASQTAKLKAHKEVLAEKQKILAERQQELQKLKQGTKTSPPSLVTQERSASLQPDVGIDEPDVPSALPISGAYQDRDLHTPVHMKRESKVSSTTKKRHTSKFEAKTRQLVEEEGISFRKMQSQMKVEDSSKSETQEAFQATDLDTYRKSAVHLHEEGPDVLVIPTEDKKWYESSQDSFQETQPSRNSGLSSKTTQSKVKPSAINTKTMATDEALSLLDNTYGQMTAKKQSKRARGTKVRFTKEALILNAALEGDLPLLRECVKELGNCSHVSDKGATCLHNAVCSGNIEMVEFLVEMGCDINAQDIDGWTPLHCAAAYSNTDMIQYLIDNGSSLFLATQDGDTPLKIAIEEYEVQRQGKSEGSQEEKEVSENQSAVESLHLLMDTQTNLGVANDGEVYALFSRPSKEPDELSFSEGEPLIIHDRGGRGEQWWMAKNMRGIRGLVPCTFLGPQCRHSVVL